MERQSAAILIIDDNDLLTLSMKHHLARQFGQVTAARTGSGALGELAAHSFRLILLDLSLPDMGGFDLLDLLRERHPDTAVIIMSADDTGARRAEAARRGAAAFIGKPFEMKALDELLRTFSV